MIPPDLAAKLAESLQALEDANDLLFAALWCDEQEDDEDGRADRARGIACAALRERVSRRFRDALDGLKEVVRAADPTLVEREHVGPIGKTDEAWLRRLLDGLGPDC